MCNLKAVYSVTVSDRKAPPEAAREFYKLCATHARALGISARLVGLGVDLEYLPLIDRGVIPCQHDQIVAEVPE